MNKKTLTALNGSIEKWERIVDETGRDEGRKNCPLCKEFLYTGSGCDGCPVKERTDSISCRETPYQKWSAHRNDAHGWTTGSVNGCKTCLRLAKAELKFLKSLLPK